MTISKRTATDAARELNASDVAAMAEWVKDCAWRGLDAEEVDDLPLHVIVHNVERHYFGGIAGFLADAR